MGSNCKLCHEHIAPGEGYHCRCGQHLHLRCRDDHERFCPARSEGWLGSVEF